MGNIDNRGRHATSKKRGEGYALSEWLDNNLNEMSGLTNTSIAEELGYERQNMISMWKTGKVRVPIDKLVPLAKLTGVDFTFLVTLWLEQYAGKAGYQEALAAFNRVTTVPEQGVLEIAREANGFEAIDPRKFSAEFKKQLKDLISLEIQRQIHA